VLFRYQGQKDSNLTQKGKDQAIKIGKRLAHIHKTEGKFSKVYVSPLGRTKETARLILDQFEEKDIECIFMSELMERSFGKFEGLTSDEVPQEAEKAMHFGDANYRPGDTGESQQEMLDRCLSALNTIYKENPGKRVLVVTHGGFISSSLGHILTPENPFRKRTFYVNNGSISVVRFSEKEKSWMLAKLNDEGTVVYHGNAQQNTFVEINKNTVIFLSVFTFIVGLGVFGYRRSKSVLPKI